MLIQKERERERGTESSSAEGKNKKKKRSENKRQIERERQQRGCTLQFTHSPARFRLVQLLPPPPLPPLLSSLFLSLSPLAVPISPRL